MAQAKMCDICGAFYSLYNKECNSKKPNGLMMLNIDEQGKYFSHKAIDLCPSCMESIKFCIDTLKKENSK